jgi:hypothetical protein
MGVVRNLAASLAVFTAVLLAGCADPYPGRVAVSGTVKFKGEPLKSGIIAFEPLEKQDTSSGASIENGSYRIPREKGLKPGKYRLRVSAGDGVTPGLPAGTGAKEEQEAAGPGRGTNIISKEMIPPSWNTQSNQEVTITEREARYDFDIPAK